MCLVRGVAITMTIIMTIIMTIMVSVRWLLLRV
jgi:hypothetical protein